MNAKFVKSLVISAILLILSVSFVVATVKVMQRGVRLVEAKKELEALQQQEIALEKEAEYRKSPQFVEEEARNKLNMVKPGEEIYLRPKIMGDDLLGAQDQRDNKAESPKPPSPFSRLFDKIKQFLLLFQG